MTKRPGWGAGWGQEILQPSPFNGGPTLVFSFPIRPCPYDTHSHAPITLFPIIFFIMR